ncbi:MAG: hypothetical protein WC779_07605 [Candidatus Omnitrophota bacterium]|jgi:hypothetical protein
MRRFYTIAMLIAALLILSAVPAICQEAMEESKETAATPATETAAPAAQEVAEPAPVVTPQAPAAPEDESAAKTNEISIYGEVQGVDVSANSMNVQYYDYDTDEEKTITLFCGNNTKFENAVLLNDVKKGDWVDAAYEPQDGKNIAKLVSVEKEEEIPDESPAEISENTSSDDDY